MTIFTRCPIFEMLASYSYLSTRTSVFLFKAGTNIDVARINTIKKLMMFQPSCKQGKVVRHLEPRLITKYFMSYRSSSLLKVLRVLYPPKRSLGGSSCLNMHQVLGDPRVPANVRSTSKYRRKMESHEWEAVETDKLGRGQMMAMYSALM